MDINKVVIGESQDKPLVEISTKDNINENEYSKVNNLKELSNFASLAAQAAPILITSRELANKTIMEVVLNGNLAKAADGNGLRAFAKGLNGQFTEHARLYKIDSLSKIVNVAAVWQIASVIVGQKHLSDINKKLDQLQDTVDKIHNFQQTERRTRIEAAFKNIKNQANILYTLTPEEKKDYYITAKELLLKNDSDLSEIYLHLKADIQYLGDSKVIHKETFGTSELENDLNLKINNLKDLVKISITCLNLRLTIYNLLSAYGFPTKIGKEMTNSILEDLEELDNCLYSIFNSINQEIRQMSSWINDTQKKVKNNKGKIIGTAVGAFSGGIVSIIAKKIGSDYDKKSKPEKGILDIRKESLHDSISCLRKYFYKQFISTKEPKSIDTLIEKEPPIKLGFRKIDESTYLCLNTGKEIKIDNIS